jgi:hypothetical protein
MSAANQKIANAPDEMTIKEFSRKIASGIRFIANKWPLVLAAALLGACLGLAYSLFKKPHYTAVCTFVLEDGSKTSTLGQYAGLASLAGIDINGGSGLFQGDNILELYKSHLMIERTLLSSAEFNGKNQLLIDRYADYFDLRQKWKNRDDIDSISFYGDPEHFNRHQDSLITDLVEKFNKDVLSVFRIDKKLSIIKVAVECKDELFAKEFTLKLVETVNKFYVQTKTKKEAQEVLVLQKQADSVRSVLNSSLSGVASSIDAAPNANPALLSLRVPSQKKQVDVQASTAVYGEIVKNLEIQKIGLRQDVPLIQIIDKPILPLASDHVKKVKGMLLGFFLGALVMSVILGCVKLFSSLSR